MTTKTPTADDLAHAKFARHPDGRIAARLDDDKFPWITAADCYGDTEMADAGWLPVRECPDPEQHDDESRLLTPDAITDEMVKRALGANGQPETSVDSPSGRRLRAILAAALIEPPARPEGAERWEDFLIDSLDYQALTDQQITDLADRIAEEMNR